ncbi:hypothetical protein MMG00_12110 [Ignatzschineria rhizosphaerae]|uniref:Uncharacterized protein n=1 Tax=Ignatzschineria rhizosphaerae TaxID=2923279 RepID=A0ABY3X2K3_9GAMM|nr:hypothetical protein [Ignatzschineria rhizosphaerae]UNM95929.1 hypothetical protein MMG00_12110 [Ignatzschineria rhizosphaerae]
MRWKVTFHSFSHEVIHTMQSEASLESIKLYAMRIFRQLRSEKKRIGKIVIKGLEEGESVYVREINVLGKPQSNWSLGRNSNE